MWKDFFYFSKGQRIAIVILLVLILLVTVLNVFLPQFYPAKISEDVSFRSQVETFKQHLDSVKSSRQQFSYDDFESNYPKYSYPKAQTEQYKLFSFDPNKADSITFMQLGLRNYVASNIIKFRKKGGVFKTKDSFSKVYGITPEKFKELEPYIAIAAFENEKSDTLQKYQKNKTAQVIVELNSADTSQLMQVSGIGRGYATGIVRFRQQTGGFVSVDQLKELYGMTDANFAKISPFCKVDATLVQKIRVNTASVDRLKQHPYISFYQAKAIYELRRKKVKLKSVQDLAVIEELSPAQLEKIKTYLSFE